MSNIYVPWRPSEKYAANDPALQRVLRAANYVYASMLARGLSPLAASLATYQTYHETGAYTNNGWNAYKNASGIMYAGQNGATRGPNGYAVFASDSKYFDAFRHELTKKNNPAAAVDLADFAARLKKNNYYEANEQDYLRGLRRAKYVLTDLRATDMLGARPDGSITKIDPSGELVTVQPASSDALNNFLSWFKKQNVVMQGAMVIGTGVIISSIVSRR